MQFFGVKTLSGTLLGPAFNACIRVTGLGATQGGCSWLFPPFSSWYLDKLVRDGAGLFDGSVYSGQVRRQGV